jgi:PelA/Pel-15E family pectate lyase
LQRTTLVGGCIIPRKEKLTDLPPRSRTTNRPTNPKNLRHSVFRPGLTARISTRTLVKSAQHHRLVLRHIPAIGMKLFSLCLISVLLASVSPTIFAAVIGTNPPSPPLSAERIAALPPADQAAWRDYLARSAAALAADKKFYADELTALGLTAPLVPAKASGRVIPIKPPGDYFASVEARRLADHLVSFQTPAGGWNKNTDFGKAPRRPGERSGYEAGYVGTIDNAATVFPLYFLAAVINATSPNPAHRTTFNRGLDYLLVAQFPSGGWPQVYPLEGGYHDAITFNDGATVNVLTFLRACAAGTGDFAFVAPTARARAAAAVERGLACILATQIVTADGRRTVWGQQHDPLTLVPVSARAYEMPAQSAGESAGMVRYLMVLPEPSPAVITAVHAAAAWFERTRLKDVTYGQAPDGSGHQLTPTPGAPSLWSRYTEIGSDRAIFGDRDRSIHDQVSGISRERRAGYAWFVTSPKSALTDYAKWSKRHPKK